MKGFLNKYEKIISLVGFLILPTLLIVSMLLQTMSYEDLFQKSHHVNSNLLTVISDTYHYIPRTGEIYQRIAVHYMTPQLSFGLDAIFRIITGLISASIFYYGTIFVLGRNLKLKYLDMFIFNLLFTMVALSPHRSVMFFGFSHINNYVVAAALSLIFANLFRLKTKYKNIWQALGVIIIGILFAMSTEITPIAFLIMGAVFSLYLIFIKKHDIRLFFSENKVQILAFIGLLLGLLIFYLGIGAARGDGSEYAKTYDYVSIMKIFSNPIFVFKKTIAHTIFNMRYLFAYILPFIFIISITKLFFKKSISKKSMPIHLFTLVYGFLYIGALSQIRVESDLYGRFVLPLFIFISASIAIFINDIYTQKQDLIKPYLKYFNTAIMLFVFIFFADVLYMLFRFNLNSRSEINSVQYVSRSAPIVIEKAKSIYPHNVQSKIFKVSKNTYTGW